MDDESRRLFEQINTVQARMQERDKERDQLYQDLQTSLQARYKPTIDLESQHTKDLKDKDSIIAHLKDDIRIRDDRINALDNEKKALCQELADAGKVVDAIRTRLQSVCHSRIADESLFSSVTLKQKQEAVDFEINHLDSCVKRYEEQISELRDEVDNANYATDQKEAELLAGRRAADELRAVVSSMCKSDLGDEEDGEGDKIEAADKPLHLDLQDITNKSTKNIELIDDERKAYEATITTLDEAANKAELTNKEKINSLIADQQARLNELDAEMDGVRQYYENKLSGRDHGVA